MSGMNLASVTRTTKDIPAVRNHPFNAQLQVMVENWKNTGNNITSPFGMRTVMENSSLFESYANDVFGDIANEDAKAALTSLLEESRLDCIRADMGGMLTHEDGSASNVTTLSYLNGPVLRAIWARAIVPAIMKTVPLKQTSYVCTFDIPYLYANGVRHDLPYSMLGDDDSDDYNPLISLQALNPVPGADDHIGTNGECIFTNNVCSGNLLAEAQIEASAINNGAAIDNRVFITSITYVDMVKGSNDDLVEDTNEKTITRKIPGTSKVGKAGDYMFMAEWPARINLKDTNGNPETDIIGIMGAIDLSTGRYRVTATSPQIKSFKWDAHLSSEDNRTPVTIRTEQHSLEVMLGKGQHIHIDTPVELLQEYPTSHQGSDYVVAMTDVLSEILAGNMNLECLQFLKTDLKNPSASSYLNEMIIRGANRPEQKFELRVAHGQSPTAYNDTMLKRCVSYNINNIRKVSRIEDGYWSILGDLNDIDLLPDFKTEGFASINGDGNSDRDDVYGFKVGYVFGFTTNIVNGKIRCLSTPEYKKQNGLHGFFTSTDDRRPTYIFHPFSYTISRGYQNPGNTLVPSIMCTKRHMMISLCPSAFQIKIIGNDDNQFASKMKSVSDGADPTGVSGETKKYPEGYYMQ
jgi:hypothetical protein